MQEARSQMTLSTLSQFTPHRTYNHREPQGFHLPLLAEALVPAQALGFTRFEERGKCFPRRTTQPLKLATATSPPPTIHATNPRQVSPNPRRNSCQFARNPLPHTTQRLPLPYPKGNFGISQPPTARPIKPPPQLKTPPKQIPGPTTPPNPPSADPMTSLSSSLSNLSLTHLNDRIQDLSSHLANLDLSSSSNTSQARSSETSKLKASLTTCVNEIEAQLSALCLASPQEEEKDQVLKRMRDMVGQGSCLRNPAAGNAQACAQASSFPSAPAGTDTGTGMMATTGPGHSHPFHPCIPVPTTPSHPSTTPIPIPHMHSSSISDTELAALKAQIAHLQTRLAQLQQQTQHLRDDTNKAMLLARWLQGARLMHGGAAVLHPALEMVLVLWVGVWVVKGLVGLFG
ncbi:uncharacterized protein EI97DRAFT_441988 [Westerdykella ornata]|uniref:Uncharacterized protein n=1 Tax=Westerdykella ornata TaxID=318751 RepID=A0A6A6JMA6_WESOR|nr:uncharacterized protein EI97DRAFT_441988 [Westerdykella ornata]KAF2277253.1 hypothetical protein EI97DRAFT_441988 [Westerdykella ornata]